jgi:hypothetical protein
MEQGENDEATAVFGIGLSGTRLLPSQAAITEYSSPSFADILHAGAHGLVLDKIGSRLTGSFSRQLLAGVG